MRPKHVFLAIFVALLWGLNYVAVPIGLKEFPPIFLSFVRLFLLSMSAIYFVKRPKVPLKMVFLYGFTMFSMQFGFLFSAIHAGLSPALAPLLLQTQVFFTAALALLFLKEKLSVWQVVGALVAFSGILLVGLENRGNATFLGIVLVLAAAISWAMGNIFCKKIGNVNMISLVVWGCLFAWPPVLFVSFLVEGAQEMGEAFKLINLASIGSILYLTFGSQFLGFLIWNRLIYLYPLATIAPFTLLIPIFGALGSTLAFSLPFPLIQGVAFLLVIAGLSIDLIGCHKKRV